MKRFFHYFRWTLGLLAVLAVVVGCAFMARCHDTDRVLGPPVVDDEVSDDEDEDSDLTPWQERRRRES